MKAKLVTYTSEHFLFLWQHFRTYSVLEFTKSNAPEVLAKIPDLKVGCAEIRNTTGELIACGICENNLLTYTCVHQDYTGKNLQLKLIKTRIRFIVKLNYDKAWVYIKCSNIASVINAHKCGFIKQSVFRFADDSEGFQMSKQLKSLSK